MTNKKSKKINSQNIAAFIAVLSIATALFAIPAAYAAPTAGSKLSQSINPGVISTDIRNASGTILSSPTFAMSAVSISNTQQTASGIFGTAAQRITVDNPGGANSGWTLSLNATVPGTTKWTSGASTYSYNGSPAQGQLTVNPNAGALVASIGSAASITKGSSASFSGTTPVTLLTAAAAADDIWQGYITGITLSQTIPASQPGGSYSIDMTQTVVAT